MLCCRYMYEKQNRSGVDEMKLFWKYCTVILACLFSFTLLFSNVNFTIERVRRDDVHLYLPLGKYAGSRGEYFRLVAAHVEKEAAQIAIGIDLHSFHQIDAMPPPDYRTTTKSNSTLIEDFSVNTKTSQLQKKSKREVNNRAGEVRKRENTIVILDEFGMISESNPSKQTPPSSDDLEIKNRFYASNGVVKTLPKAKHNCFKKILLWEDRLRYNAPEAAGTFFCPDISCKVQVSYSNGSIDKISKADAVVIHHSAKKDLQKMITKRKVGQKWVLATRESPLQSSIEPPGNLRSVYDWVMTYRQGADFSLAWGYFDRGVPQWKEGVNRNWASGKNRFLAWNKSNCSDTPSSYIEFVSRLNKYMPVNIPQQCRLTDGNTEECQQSIRQFKFLLALENSECKDFITQTFWETALKNDVVPIVFGPPKSNYERIAPQHSFIHLDDFTKVADLVKYLKKLDNNDTLYNEYFLWKKEGKVVSTKESWTFNSRDKMCEVAGKLRNPGSNQPNIGLYDKIIGPWWKGSCAKRKLPG
ncbi:alpha-(1,3)-fucosyltransferase 7-like [Antedon mediterranea]|uniref:alpha-(1,3)-fucosyltransferase 7-like n=1 Tax=Antedon mediterranea TaxID=105859 RepID=UPI003AF5ABEC